MYLLAAPLIYNSVLQATKWVPNREAKPPGFSMSNLQLFTFGVIIGLLVFCWGALMAFSPQRFWNLAKVDWNADVIDTRDRRKRHMVRIAGWMIIAISVLFLVGIVIAAVKYSAVVIPSHLSQTLLS